MQAAIGIEQVKKMDRLIAKRNENARYLTERLKNVPGIETPKSPPGANALTIIMRSAFDPRSSAQTC